MGCTSSKQSVCPNCHAQHSPMRMSYSSLPNHSPPRGDDNHHVVALTSTTLGYLLLEPSTKPNHQQPVPRNVPEKNSQDFAVGVIEAKTWSKMIDEKINKVVPQTPAVTPPCEPETINAWELMEGLDQDDPSPPQSPLKMEGLDHCNPSPFQSPSTMEHTCCSSFNNNPNSSPLDDQAALASNSNSNDYNRDDAKNSLEKGENEIVQRQKAKLILYFTSLRGVRKTYEDCCQVRAILKNYGARVDERDVSMHSGFKEELKELLGDGYNGGGLPKVFVGKKYIGGFDEIRRFHDEYKLDEVLEGCETVDECGGGGVGGGCEACGDIRFLPCEKCSGSCKVYYEVESNVGDDDEIEENDCGFQRCPDCNENGLIRCPICCD